ncbi:MAG: PIG-L family deacetylase [Planctomycetaceae bacterium]
MTDKPTRVLVLGAHPDDAEYHSGGLAALHCDQGHVVKLVSVTDGGAGHHQREPEALVALRRQEAQAAGQILGIEYVTWDFHDGALQPSLDVRQAIIKEIRTFQADLVLTHRPHDYHPDHRAVGQAVQDASYLITVPHVVPDVPALVQDPVVAYMPDLFTRPYPLQPDVVVDISSKLDIIVAMLDCQASQVYEWLPYLSGQLEQVPDGSQERIAWLKNSFRDHVGGRADRYRETLCQRFGEDRGNALELIEVYEISEYASQLSDDRRQNLFPGGV